MSPEVETIAGKSDNSFHLSLVKHAGRMKDNEVLSGLRPNAAGLRTVPSLDKRKSSSLDFQASCIFDMTPALLRPA